MFYLLKTWSFSHYRKIRLNLIVTLLGVAFGVAVYSAVGSAVLTLRDSFQRTVEQVAGKGRIEISGGEEGFPEERLLFLNRHPGVVDWMPMIFQTVRLTGNGKENIEVMAAGIDLFQAGRFHTYAIAGKEGKPVSPGAFLDPEALFVSEDLSARLGLTIGSRVGIGAENKQETRTVAGILRFEKGAAPFGGDFILMDIAAAQDLFHKTGKLDRAVLMIAEGSAPENLKREIAGLLPGLTVRLSGQRTEMVNQMLGSFNLNLKALSEISVLVGMFLIFNILSAMVVRRQAELGILKSLGVTGREIQGLILLEAAALGLIGSGVGILLGWVISGAVLKTVSLTVSSLYLKTYVRKSDFPVSLVLESLFMGTAVSLAAAWFPAREASMTPPRETISREREIQLPSLSWKYIGFGGGLILIWAVLFLAPPVRGIPVFGYLSGLSLLIGLSFLIVPLLYLVYSVLESDRLKRHSLFLRVSGAGLFHSPGRSAVAISALMAAISLWISVTVMIQSFRSTVVEWIHQTIRADLVVESEGWISRTGPRPFLREAMAGEIENIHGVAGVDRYREERIPYGNEEAILNARDLQTHRLFSHYLLTSGDFNKTMKEALEKDEVLVSERFSLRFHVAKGDRILVPTPKGDVSFLIGGVFYDYTTQGGRIVLDRSLYGKYWNDSRFNVLAIYLDKRLSPQVIRTITASIENRAGQSGDEQKGVLISNREIRERILEIFDETFALTRALEWITVLIALLGVANLLILNILERKREIGIMRSVGFSAPQVKRMVLYEAGWISVIANLLGLAGGIGLSLVLIYVINKQSFQWTILFDFSWFLPLRVFLGVSAVALVAGYFAAMRAAQGVIADAVHYE